MGRQSSPSQVRGTETRLGEGRILRAASLFTLVVVIFVGFFSVGRCLEMLAEAQNDLQG